MRVLIDCTQIPLKRTGVGVYADELLKELPKLLQAYDTLYVLIQSDDTVLREILSVTENVCVLTASSRFLRNRLLLAIYEQLILPWILLRKKIDVVHSLHYTHPLVCPCARAVTIHDMTFFLIPEMHTTARKLIFSFFIKRALHRAEAVIFVSESTKRDAQRICGVINDRQFVIPLGVDTPRFTEISESRRKATLLRLNIDRPYILFVGTMEPRKNVKRLIHAFERLGPYSNQYKLIIVGRLGWDYEDTLQAIQNSPLKHNILRLGYLAAADKAVLLAACDLLVYPSLYEGFGLPILEGMAAGAPVITSVTSSLPEVAGRAAVLVNPECTEEIASSMRAVLSDTTYAKSLREAGRMRAREFTWEKTASLTYKAYQKAEEYKNNLIHDVRNSPS
jgi:glycosyltransferase involved in cell wall biosynthesis